MTNKTYSFGKASLSRLSECDARLQELMRRVIRRRDCSIVCGYRGKDEQNKAYAEGKSMLMYPESKHNQTPSLAVDVVPWPEKWGSDDAFIELNGVISQEAKEMGLKIRWGGDWDGDGDRTDQRFHDLPHYELVEV